MPPKRKADAISKTEPTTDGNLTFRPNTHYPTLLLDISSRVPYIPAVYTYEGVRLCPECLQICGLNHKAPSGIGGCRVVVPEHTVPCDRCKMPLMPRSNDANRHRQKAGKAGESLCNIVSGLSATEDFWKPDAVFKTLICPACKMPGFNLDTFKEHLRNNDCVGKKEYVFKTRKTMVQDQIIQCNRCEYWFKALVFPTHVCGSDLDPIWLGRQDTFPDISKPYLVWGHELPPPYGPTGFGGGYRRGGDQGAIPPAALEESWAAPFATSLRFRSERIQIEDLCSLIRKVSRLLSDQGVLDTLQHSPDPPEYNAAWASTISEKEISDKVQTMSAEFQRLQRIKNENILRQYGITYERVQGAETCHGFAWLHGSFACRHRNPINLGTVTLTRNPGYINLGYRGCIQCRWDAAAIINWTRYSKFNGQGQRLCTRPGCQEVLLTSTDCAEHDEKRRAMRLASRVSRLARRTDEQQGPPEHVGRRRKFLWRILSPGDIASFFSNLTEAQFSTLDKDWRNVKTSLTADKDYSGPAVFHIDTESSRVLDQQPDKKKLIPFELAILDRFGTVVVNTTIDYNKSIADLMRGVSPQLVAKTCTIYGLQNTSGKTHGMTPDQLHQKLREIGLNQDSILVEHSNSGWDREALATIYPDTPQRTLTTFQLLRSLQYSGPIDLQTMFHVIWPDSKMNVMHHRALWDVCKMLLVLRCIFNRGVVEEADVAEFMKICVAFREKNRARSHKTRAGNVSFEGDGPNSKQAADVESDHDPLELEDEGSDYDPLELEDDESDYDPFELEDKLDHDLPEPGDEH